MQRNEYKGIRQPGEWAQHRACWLAFPSDPELWPTLDEAQASFVIMAKAIAKEGKLPAEQLEILVKDQDAFTRAQQLLQGLPVRLHVIPFGDIWMRDIAPVFVKYADGRVATVRYIFNGWGEKYSYPGDDRVAEKVQALLPHEHFASPLVIEGGGVESDGAGSCLTTVDVALNANRNPSLTKEQVERMLKQSLGAERVIWVARGLRNDHTDGHIDNIARFIGENRVVCARPSGEDDPNREVLAEIEQTLRDAGLQVETIPSPGLVLGRDGEPLPASYLNFYIANNAVVVPVFGTPHDDTALRALEALFPGRPALPVPAKVFLQEGGTVHCISQQEPV